MLDVLSFTSGVVSAPFLYCALAIVILTVEVALDATIFSSCTLAVVTLGAWWLGYLDLMWMRENWKLCLAIVAAYPLLGAIWSVVKWWFFLHDQAASMQDRIDRIQQQNSDDPVRLSRQLTSLQQEGDWPPRVGNHKSRIMKWICWWPFSFIGTMFNNPIRWVCEGIYNNMIGLLQGMSNRIWARIKFPEMPKLPTDVAS